MAVHVRGSRGRVNTGYTPPATCPGPGNIYPGTRTSCFPRALAITPGTRFYLVSDHSILGLLPMTRRRGYAAGVIARLIVGGSNRRQEDNSQRYR